MINQTLNDLIDHHNDVLKQIVASAPIEAPCLKEATAYALFPGGKRLRPLLVYLTGQVLSVDQSCLDSIAAAIECVHTYSLAHDDLPAMDNDDYRRGRLSCHRAFDEATAILTGDGLQALAISHLAETLPLYLSPKQSLNIIKILAKAIGFSGMVSGQSLDLSELTKTNLSLEELLKIHELKTGHLFSACVNMVLEASTASDAIKSALINFAEIFGLAYQMQDDYLDAYASPDLLGKNRASDLANQKRTFAYYYDKKTLGEKIEAYYDRAKKSLDHLGEKAKGLLDFIEIVQKTK